MLLPAPVAGWWLSTKPDRSVVHSTAVGNTGPVRRVPGGPTSPGGVMAASLFEFLNPFAGSVGGAPSIRCIAAGVAVAGFARWQQRRNLFERIP